MVHHHGVDAWTLLKEAQQDDSKLITMCRSIDEMLDGGIRTGQITEIAGPPGIGKSQFA